MVALTAGVMTLTIEYAKDLKDRDWFCRMDPYCIVKVGGRVFRSRTAKNGGRNPVWNDTFKFNIINENDVSIEIKDDDIGRDEYIGSATFKLARVRQLGSDRINVPVTSKRSNKQYGMIAVALHWSPNAMSLSPANGYPVAPSAPAYIPPPTVAPPPPTPLQMPPPPMPPPPPVIMAPPLPAPGYIPAPQPAVYVMPTPPTVVCPTALQVTGPLHHRHVHGCHSRHHHNHHLGIELSFGHHHCRHHHHHHGHHHHHWEIIICDD